MADKRLMLISSCLLGVRCRYDAKRTEPHPEAQKLYQEGRLVPLCPELLGGLSCPRDPAEIQPDGRILTSRGEDVSEAFARGATQVLNACLNLGIKQAVLKERSPSCGSMQVYDGVFSGNLISGMGCCTRLLREHGIEVYSESILEDWKKKREK